MATIDPNNILQAYMREQAHLQRQQGTQRPSPLPTKHWGDEPLAPQLQETMVSRIGAISRNDPQAKRKAFRCFLEYTLKKQLGASVGLDPGFNLLVDRVHETMEQDKELALAMDKAGQILLKTHGRA